MNQDGDAGSGFPDLEQAPFHLQAGSSPATVAEQMVACFRAVAGLDRPSSQVFEAAVACVGMGPSDPLTLAGSRIAADMDAAPVGQPYHAYHNAQHTCEVVLCSLLLARQAGLSGHQQARVLVAALVHDFRHDGTTNAGRPFRLELSALTAARPYLVGAGVTADEMERIVAIVLATEPSLGLPYARRCFRFHHLVGPRPETVPAGIQGIESLDRLAADQDLALEAVLLAEADLLPSVALTDDYSMLCQQRLSRENRNITPGSADKLSFLNQQVQGFLVAGFFEPNLRRLRDSIAAALARSQGSSGEDESRNA